MKSRLTKTQALHIVEQFMTEVLPSEPWYQQVKKSTKAVVLYGSTAKNLNRADSDIDLLLFMPLEAEERYTAGEYFYDFHGREINIVIRSIEGLHNIAEEQKDLFQKEVFRESVIVDAADDEVRCLLDQIAAIKI
jgi:predicted nucleotidyltransferase